MHEQNDIKRVKISVAGEEYTLLSRDDEGYVKDLAETLDEALTQLKKSGSNTTSALVLTALNYLDEYNKASEDGDRLRAQITEYGNDFAKARAELNAVRKENEKLVAEVADLREKLKKAKEIPTLPSPEAVAQKAKEANAMPINVMANR